MGKISPVVAKYIIHATINIEGSVDKPDVIGAVFGQTEGLLGSDLELRELQKSGKIGRIEVKVDIKDGKSKGTITIPSSLDITETTIIAAAIETIQRIGPCDSKVKIDKIEDVRVSKREFVFDRAKELLSGFKKDVSPDSHELTERVSESVKVSDIKEYGKERLSAGPDIDGSDELIVVEGRADVIALLKIGIKNVIALNGTSVPNTIKELSKKKETTVFLDGDRGGDLILKELKATSDIDFVARAPNGMEVEELSNKEIHKALRSKVSLKEAIEKAKKTKDSGTPIKQDKRTQNRIGARTSRPNNRDNRYQRQQTRYPQRPRRLSIAKKDKELLKNMLHDLVGTRGAYILDNSLNILGKVPTSELSATISELRDTHAVVMDGIVTKELIELAEKKRIKILIATSSKAESTDSRVSILTEKDLT